MITGSPPPLAHSHQAKAITACTNPNRTNNPFISPFPHCARIETLVGEESRVGRTISILLETIVQVYRHLEQDQTGPPAVQTPESIRSTLPRRFHEITFRFQMKPNWCTADSCEGAHLLVLHWNVCCHSFLPPIPG